MTISRAEAWALAPVSRRVVLGIDPGERAGASLVVVNDAGGVDLVWSHEVDTMTREVERVLAHAFALAREAGTKVVIVAEEWGRGGPLGLEQWMGLGMHVGAWRRAAFIAHAEGASDAFAKSSGFVRVGMSSWRAAMLPGVALEAKRAKGSKAKTEVWKRAATRRVLELWPGLDPRRFGANAAESALIALYATRDVDAGEAAVKAEKLAKLAERAAKPKTSKSRRKRDTIPAPAPVPRTRRRVQIERLPLPLPATLPE